jgi:hypothetical protein
MKNTYRNFGQLSKLYYNQEADINYVVLDYQATNDPVCLAFVFCKLFPYTILQTNKYHHITTEDKASFAVEELSKAMRDYSPLSKKAKIQTLFDRYLHNRLRMETEKVSFHNRRANNGADNYEFVADKTIYMESQYDQVEFIETLRSMNLSDNALKYCELIVRTSDNKIKDTDIAKMLGISSTAIHYIKESLVSKLDFAI